MATSNANTPCPSNRDADDAPLLRTLLLERGEHRWILRWSPGDERTVMEWAIELADQNMVGLSPSDARTVAEAVAEAIQRYVQHAPATQAKPAGG